MGGINLSAKILVDDDTRKQIRDLILDQVRAATRGKIHETVEKEAERVARSEVMKLAQDRWRIDIAFHKVLVQVLQTKLDDITKEIMSVVDGLVEKAADKVVAKKLANKTVFEAEKQHDYVVKIVRAELKKAFSSVKGFEE